MPGLNDRRPHNELLSILPAADLAKLEPLLEPISIKQRRVLHHDRAPMEHVYFIESGLVSVLAQIDTAKAVEVCLIGREGLSGLPIVLGGSMSPHRRVVQLGGSALRMRAADLHAAMQSLPRFATVLLRYAQSRLVQTSQAGACNSTHPFKQRLARWLLTAHDGLDGDLLPVTHDMLARLLGVRRATVSECIALLERDGVLGTARAQITIVDRARLEEMACACYRVMTTERERMLRDLSFHDGPNGVAVAARGACAPSRLVPMSPRR